MAALLDPLSNFVPRKVSGHQVLVALESHANPFTKSLHGSSYKSLLDSRKRLPIFTQINEFYNIFNQHQVIVIVGETGSGKTTQVPQFVCFSDLPHLNGKSVACTQPRRVAAISVAKRVAEEMDVSLGKEVGYSTQFEDMTQPGTTFLKYLTDGSLLREATADPDLQQYSTIIIDEAHERSLATDILMGLLKMILRRRPDLKLIIMSATLNAAAKFRKHFSQSGHGVPLFKVLGRAFPVEIFYTREPEPDYLDAAVRTVFMVHRTEDPGDILLFLTGGEEIQDACKRIAAEADELINQDPDNVGPLVCLPLYSSLPDPSQQLQRVFEPPRFPQLRRGPPGRRVIISTNIAETSLTLDGIVYVVDPGFSKLKVYNPRIRVESLLNTPISKASAQHRAGHAGRTRPGKCFRLYTEKDFVSELEAQDHPEILRCNLAHTVLELAKLGIEDLIHFDYIDAPAPETLMRGLELLNYLGALDDNGALTPLGAMMAEFPLDPQMARTLIASPEFDCSHEILTIIAMLNTPNVCVCPNGECAGDDRKKQLLAITEGDHLSLMNAYNAYQQNKNDPTWALHHNLSQGALAQAEKIRTQLVGLMERLGLPTASNINSSPASQYGNIQRALICGYFMQVAHKEGCEGGYLTVKDNQVVSLHPTCTLDPAPEWVLFNEFILTTRPYIRTVTAVRAEWLLDLAPEYFALTSFPDSETKRSLQRARKKTRACSSTGTGKRSKRG